METLILGVWNWSEREEDETVISGLRYGFSFYGRAEDEISRGFFWVSSVNSWQERDEY